jgi:beta-glucosidase-like glycosyl hydrolase
MQNGDDAGRKNTTVSLCSSLGALPLTESHLVYQVGKQIGLDLKSAGLHYNLAPLADNNNPNNPVIGYRSFGENKEKVAQFSLGILARTQ